jgi:hypothetical protein
MEKALKTVSVRVAREKTGRSDEQLKEEVTL